MFPNICGKRKRWKALLKTEVIASNYNIKQKYIVDEDVHALVSTLKEKWKTTESQPVKNMTSACSIYTVDSKSFAEKLGSAAGEDLSEKVNLYLADYHYNLRRDGSDGSPDYNMFGSSDVKETSKVLRDLIKTEAHV